MAQSWEQEEPLRGNRVKGQLIKIGDSGIGYIAPKDHVIIHVFWQNIVRLHPAVDNVISTSGADRFTPYLVPANMQFQELIEQLDTVVRGRHHIKDYPEEHCGVQELIDMGNGRFLLGQKIMMHDSMARHTPRSLWPGSIDHSEPRHLVRWPS